MGLADLILFFCSIKDKHFIFFNTHLIKSLFFKISFYIILNILRRRKNSIYKQYNTNN